MAQGLKQAESLIPRGFKGTISWGVLDNRPYLRMLYEQMELDLEGKYTLQQARRGAQKLLRLNRADKQYVEVILLSRNSADTGLRVFNSIKHYGLDITRAAFTKGEATSRYVPAFGAHLFLSADPGDVKRALADGYAAATIVARKDRVSCCEVATGTTIRADTSSRPTVRIATVTDTAASTATSTL